MTEWLQNVHLLRPAWLLAALPAMLLAWLAWRRSRSGQGWRQVIDPDLLPHLLHDRGGGGSASPAKALLLAWLLATLAMAGPSWEKIPQPVQRKQDAMVILLDLSFSMLTEDLSPSRLQRARHKLLDLLQLRDEGSTALVAYAGDAHVVAPLTDDTRTIANLLPALDPTIMPLKGNQPALAVEQALQLLGSAGALRGQILLVSDGVRDSDVKKITKLLTPSQYTLSVLGVGTTNGGPIPIPGQGLLKDDGNEIVIAALEREPLRRLARENGGTYTDLSLDDSDLDRVIQAPFDPNLEQDLLLDRSADQWHDMGYWLVLALLPLAAASFRRGWLLCLPLVVVLQPAPAQAFEWQDLWLTRDQQAARLLEQGDTAAAAETFEDPAWQAAARYRANEFDAALEHYSASDDARSWYNRGNALAKSGRLDEAIAAYDEALARQPEMEDAAFNKALLEKLKEQQQNQQQNQDRDQDQQQQRDQQQQDQQNQDQKNQQQRDQQQNPQQEQDQQQQRDREDPQQEQRDDGKEQAEQQRPPDEGERQPQEREEEAKPDTPPEQDPQDVPDDPEEQQQAQAQQRDEDQEREQAIEQWLRRVPDDPAGLLRRKFLYESQQNKRRQRDSDETDW